MAVGTNFNGELKTTLPALIQVDPYIKAQDKTATGTVSVGASQGGPHTYLMRGYDTVLARTVYWLSMYIIDSTGAQYTTPANLTASTIGYIKKVH